MLPDRSKILHCWSVYNHNFVHEPLTSLVVLCSSKFYTSTYLIVPFLKAAVASWHLLAKSCFSSPFSSFMMQSTWYRLELQQKISWMVMSRLVYFKILTPLKQMPSAGNTSKCLPILNVENCYYHNSTWKIHSNWHKKLSVSSQAPKIAPVCSFVKQTLLFFKLCTWKSKASLWSYYHDKWVVWSRE